MRPKIDRGSEECDARSCAGYNDLGPIPAVMACCAGSYLVQSQPRKPVLLSDHADLTAPHPSTLPRTCRSHITGMH